MVYILLVKIRKATWSRNWRIFLKKSHFCYIFGIVAEIDDIDSLNQFHQRKIDPSQLNFKSIAEGVCQYGYGKIYNIVLIARTTSDTFKFVRNRLTTLFCTETDGLTTKTSGEKLK